MKGFGYNDVVMNQGAEQFNAFGGTGCSYTTALAGEGDEKLPWASRAWCSSKAVCRSPQVAKKKSKASQTR